MVYNDKSISGFEKQNNKAVTESGDILQATLVYIMCYDIGISVNYCISVNYSEGICF